MEQVHVVRHKVLMEGQGQRRVARDMGLSCNTVKKYLGLDVIGASPSRQRRTHDQNRCGTESSHESTNYWRSGKVGPRPSSV